MISNELDIDFIHGDIHGRSCKILYRVIIIFGNGLSLVRCDLFYRSLTYDPCSGLDLGLGLCLGAFIVTDRIATYIMWWMTPVFKYNGDRSYAQAWSNHSDDNKALSAIRDKTGQDGWWNRRNPHPPPPSHQWIPLIPSQSARMRSFDV